MQKNVIIIFQWYGNAKCFAFSIVGIGVKIVIIVWYLRYYLHDIARKIAVNNNKKWYTVVNNILLKFSNTVLSKVAQHRSLC